LIRSGKTRPVYQWQDEQEEIVVRHWRSPEGPAAWVAVRPCEEDFGDKTFLGLLVGDVALSVNFSDAGLGEEDGTHVVEIGRSDYNPLILIPELGRTVLGCGSWWSIVKCPEDLKKISDADINSVWYVQAAKALEGKE
jgi:hypothetical protein